MRLKDIYNIFIDGVDFLHDGESGGPIDGDMIYATNAPLLKVSGSNFANRGSLHTGTVRGIYGLDNCAYYEVMNNTFNGIKDGHVVLDGTTGQIYAHGNTHLGGAGYTGYRTTANIVGTIDNNNFIGTFLNRVLLDNPSLVVKNNTPEDGLVNFTSGATTPSVGGKNTSVFGFNNSSATTVTTFTNGTPNQQITVVAQNGNTTIANSGTLITRNTTTRLLAAAEVVRFLYDGSTWREIW